MAFSARKTLSVSSVGSRGNTQLTQTVGQPAFRNYVAGNMEMKPLSLLALFLIPYFALAGCTPASPMIHPTQSETVLTIATTILPLAITNTAPSTPTVTAMLPTVTPSQTETLTLVNTLEPKIAKATIEPLLQEPMNCAVPCFWGIRPGITHFDQARIFFSKLGFIPFEGTEPNGTEFYTITYNKSNSGDSSVTFIISNNFVESITVDPRITKQKEGSPREWIVYSPETLIKRYGSPSSVRFTVSSYGIAGSPMNIGMNMIMYFDTSDLTVWYSGIHMTPQSFCPLTDTFDFVRLEIGSNTPAMPSFETVSLEKATSLTMDQFTQLMLGDHQKACFTVKAETALP